MMVSADLVRAAAPKGRLRVALNHGNAVLVSRGPDDAHPRGVSVAVARALAEQLGVKPEFLHFDRAGDVSAAAGDDVWDLCFLAIDPKRAESITFSEPYVAIEGCFAVREDSPAHSPSEVDALRQTIGIVKGSAYALHLTRGAAGGAQYVIFETAGEAEAAFESRQLDGIAGVRQAMQRVVNNHPGLRIIDEPFMEIPQAVGVPAGRQQVADYVARFVREMKANGFVARVLAENGHRDVRVP